MHPFADRVVLRVQKAGGLIPLPDAWPDLAELERLAQGISRRAEPRFEEFAAPLHIKGEAFHQPTVGAISWARRLAEQFPRDPDIGEIALLYSLTVADVRKLPDEPATARIAVGRWARRTRIAMTDAREIFALLFPAQRETDEGALLKALRMEHGDDSAKWPDPALREAVGAWLALCKAADAAAEDRSVYKSIIFAVMREYGGTLDHWIFEVSLDALLAAADEILKQSEAKLAAEKKAHGVACAERWSVDAQARFTLFARAFERKYAPAGARPQKPAAPSSEPRTAGAP